MDVRPVERTDSAGAGRPLADESVAVELRRSVVAATRTLNDLSITDRKFSVARDPESHRFVVLLVNSSTGEVIDQFPPENIVRILSQLTGARKQESGDSAE